MNRISKTVNRAHRRTRVATAVVSGAHTRRRQVFAAGGAVIVVLGLASAAVAYFISTGSGTGAATVGHLNPPTNVVAGPANLVTVPVSWSASAVDGSAVAPAGYYVTESNGSVTKPACGSNSTHLIVGTSCTDGNGTLYGGSGAPANAPLASGSYTYTVTAADNSWSAASAPSGSVVVDSVPPTVPTPGVAATTTYVSGGTTYVNSEALTLTDSATDPGGPGINSVTYYYCVGSGSCTSSNGVSIGSSSIGSSYSVTWSSPSPDGTYQIIAVGTDTFGNATTSPAISIRVDTTPPSISTPNVNGYS